MLYSFLPGVAASGGKEYKKMDWLRISFDHIPVEDREALRQKIVDLAFDHNDVIGHPELVDVFVKSQEHLERLFPQLAGHVRHL